MSQQQQPQQHDKEKIVRKVKQIVVRDITLSNNYLEKLAYYEPTPSMVAIFWALNSCVLFTTCTHVEGSFQRFFASVLSPLVLIMVLGVVYQTTKLLHGRYKLSWDVWSHACGLFAKGEGPINLLPLATDHSDELISRLYDSVTSDQNYTEAHIMTLLIDEVVAELATLSRLDESFSHQQIPRTKTMAITPNK